MSNPKGKLTVGKRPCGSCPYRKDVPSGVWAQSEYDKLPKYDGELWEQDQTLFMCHQRDGHLCAGWVACHSSRNLLSLLVAGTYGKVDPSVLDYTTDVPVFSSGAEAREHGMRDIRFPSPEAKALVSKLEKLIEGD